MIRYIVYSKLQQKISSFCCSRVIFSGLQIKVKHPTLFFDSDFLSELKRYNRSTDENAKTSIIRGVCGKCDGYGIFDWVTRITTDDGATEKAISHVDTTRPVVVKNENPIKTVYINDQTDRIKFYYISDFMTDDLTYRCDQCLGIGLDVDISKIVELHTDQISDIISKPKPKPKPIIRTKGYLRKLLDYIFN